MAKLLDLHGGHLHFSLHNRALEILSQPTRSDKGSDWLVV